MHAKLLHSCPTLCNPVDCSALGFSVHGILQARVLEWGAIAFSTLDLHLGENVHLENKPVLTTVSGVKIKEAIVRKP